MEVERFLQTHTNEDTVRAILEYGHRYVSDPTMIELSRKLCSNVEDTRSKCLALVNWVKANLIYVDDTDEARRLTGYNDGPAEVLKSPLVVLETKRYDCDCICTLLLAVLANQGLTLRVAMVGFHPYEVTGPDGYEHVYVQALDPATDLWLICDPVSHPNEQKMILDTVQSRLYPF